MKIFSKSSTMLLFLLLSILASVQTASAQIITMPQIFGNGMVLQQKSQVPIWGWAKPGAKVKVVGSWGKAGEALSGKDGKWKTTLETPKAKAGKAPIYTFTVTGPENSITFSDVLVGEVWVCGGQSNMEFSMSRNVKKLGLVDYKTDISKADFKNIRLFNVKKDSSIVLRYDCKGSWEKTTPERIASFSAVGYYFGKTLYEHLDIPIGLIQDAFSGSGIQCWIKKEVLESDTDLKTGFLEKEENTTTKKPSLFYNAMISPVIPFAIKGVLWYQGETNVGKNDLYAKANISMIKDWRKDWGSDFSFYAVQMTPRYYVEKQKNDVSFALGYFREAQDKIMQLPKTGIVVTTDLMLNAEERSETHPDNKKDIGFRLAFWALAKDYGKIIQYRGPVYSSLEIKDNKAILSFEKKSLGSGLITKDGANAKCFKIAGEDAKFYPAEAFIKGDKIVVYSPRVEKPVAVRYAFTNGALSNLQNKEGLAAYPFRTDTFKVGSAVDLADNDIK